MMFRCGWGPTSLTEQGPTFVNPTLLVLHQRYGQSHFEGLDQRDGL